MLPRDAWPEAVLLQDDPDSYSEEAPVGQRSQPLQKLRLYVLYLGVIDCAVCRQQ